MTYEEIQRANRLIFDRLAIYLNANESFVTADMVRELSESASISCDEAFSYLVCAALGLNTENDYERLVWQSYSPFMLHHLDESHFTSDAYYKAVRIGEKRKINEWELRVDKIAPYTLFVCDDPLTLPDGRIIPQIGYFDCDFSYLSVLQGNREWMTLMPNEIVTQRLPIKKARGRVCTYGLGLGYFAFMCAEKEDVESVTIVERDESVITLFKELLLPCFSHKEKIEIVQADAFEFAEKEAPARNFDYIFADIWHDPSDGVDAYKRFKSLEHLCPDTSFDYWIEKTLLLYM